MSCSLNDQFIHQRFGHASHQHNLQMAKLGIYTGLPNYIPELSHPCFACIITKGTWIPRDSNSSTKNLDPVNRFHIDFSFFKKVSFQKLTSALTIVDMVIYSWLIKRTNSHFAIQAKFFQTHYHISAKKSPHLNQNKFQSLFNLELTASLFQHFTFNWLCIIKSFGSWATSLSLYPEPVIIWLDLRPTSFQLTVTSSSQMTSSNFFFSQLYFIHANFYINIKSSIHSTVSETTS